MTIRYSKINIPPARSAVVCLVLLSLAVLAVGCSNDSTSTAPANEPQSTGDTAMISNMMGDAVLSTPTQTILLSEALLANESRISGRRTAGFASLSSDDDIIITSVTSYSYSDGWHIFEFEATVIDHDIEDTVDIAGIDSVQVLVGGEPVQEVANDDFVDGLRARAHVDWDLRSGDATADANHAIDVGIAVSEMDTIVTVGGMVNDTVQSMFVGDSASCSVYVTLDQLIDNLQVYAGAGDDQCPIDGFISSTAHIEADCVSFDETDSASVNGTWTITAEVVGDGNIRITFEGPVLTWSVTESCEEASASGARWWTSRPHTLQ